MTQHNLVLTEKAINRHTKRLQKELSKLDHKLKLSEAQNMFSRILGMKDYHNLQNTLFPENLEKENLQQSNNIDSLLNQIQNNIYTLEYAKTHMNHFFKNGDLHVIANYISKEGDIKEYIKKNSTDLFAIAAKNSQNFICEFMIEKNLLCLDNLMDEKQEWLFYYDLIIYNYSMFEKLFYENNSPSTVTNYFSGMVISTIIEYQQLENLKKILLDKRIDKNFFWGGGDQKTQLYYCALNRACRRGHLETVKYLIEVEGQKPLENGSTVQRACLSGNLALVKYIIEEQNAKYHYFNKSMISRYSLEQKRNMLNSSLDESTLSAAVLSGNIDLIKYLLEDLQLDISQYDYLALKTALIENSVAYSYLIEFSQCRDYLEQHAQEIFEEIIHRKTASAPKDLNKNMNQLNIVTYLIENYEVKVEKIVYDTNNSLLINYLKNIMN